MHFVDRGPEPATLKGIRSRRTPKWVGFYRHGKGPKPTDSDWRSFVPELDKAFSGLCAYCESWPKGEVDHFQPKSRFPEQVYEWSNWLFACHDCNQAKGDKWPAKGYVDPCAKSRQARPESFFDFDTFTGEILPRKGLSKARSKKAWHTIDDLGLNRIHHLKNRRTFISMVSSHPDIAADPEAFVRAVTARNHPYSSILRVFIREIGYSVDEEPS